MKRFDWVLLTAVIALTAVGALVQIRMANLPGKENELLPLIAGLAAGTAVAIACIRFGTGFLERLRWPALVVAAAALGAMAVLGHRYRGGVYLAGNLNPSELVKPLAVLFAAGVLAQAKTRQGHITVVAAALVALGCGILAAGVLAVHDFGLLALLALTVGVLLFVASWRWGLVALGGLVTGVTICALHPVGHLAARLAIWRDPFADPTGSGWQTLQGLAAMLAGGVHGEGLGQGAVQVIPIVSSDFVYAALAEELGLVGCAALLVLYLVLFVRGLMIAGRAATPFRAYLAAGLVASLAVQTLLNVAGVTNALPMTGITLPLISHGGSSLAVTLFACGLLLGLSAAPAEQKSGPSRAPGTSPAKG